MAKTRLFVIRHGRTMFNTIGRAQGWSDTPLTAEGERGIQALGIGLRESGKLSVIGHQGLLQGGKSSAHYGKF